MFASTVSQGVFVFFGLGLNIIIALFFAVHCVRTQRQLFWLFILFAFPLLGSLVYFIVEFLPDLRLGTRVSQAGAVASRVLDPSRELRDARAALDMTPTAQNRMRLAHALMAAGQPADATAEFEECLKGPFALDSEIAFAAAHAHLASQQSQRALQLLREIRTRDTAFRGEAMAVAMAQALTALGEQAAAGDELRAAWQRYGGIESRGEYAIWAAQNGDLKTARELQVELQKSYANWSDQTRTMHRPLMKRVEAALQGNAR